MNEPCIGPLQCVIKKARGVQSIEIYDRPGLLKAHTGCENLLLPPTYLSIKDQGHGIGHVLVSMLSDGRKRKCKFESVC